MNAYLMLAVGFVVGVGLTLFARLGWMTRRRSHRRREMAAAFVGEIVAILREIEIEKLDDILERQCAGTGDDVERKTPELHLPRFAVYDANVKRIGLFSGGLPREIAGFYTQLATLRDELLELASAAAGTMSSADCRDRKWRVLAELKETLDLGDQILRELRPMLRR
jgi:hypothetical protein